jgi:hypothetical protein
MNMRLMFKLILNMGWEPRLSHVYTRIGTNLEVSNPRRVLEPTEHRQPDCELISMS